MELTRVTSNSSAKVSDIERLTDLDAVRLTKLSHSRVLEPSTPGVRGHQEREYDVPRTVAAMVIGDLRAMGIDRERQCGPIVREIVNLPQFPKGVRPDGTFRLPYTAFPRWVSFGGREAIASDDRPEDPACIVIDLHSYLARMSLLLELQYVQPPSIRLRVLAHAGLTGKGTGAREALRYSMAVLEGVIEREDAAKRLGMSADDIRTDQLEWLAAKPAQDPPEQESVERRAKFFAFEEEYR